MGFIKPAFFLLSTHALFIGLFYGANTAFPLIPPQLKLPGTIGLVSLAYVVALAYCALFKPKHVTTSTYLTASLFYFMTTFDLTNVVDFQMRPNNILVTNYLNCGDPMVVNVWTDLIVYLDASLPHLLHLIVFYRMFNGLSWRSLYLFNLGAWVALTVPFYLPLFAPQATQLQLREKQNVSYGFYSVVLVVLYALKKTIALPRANNLGKEESGKAGKGKQQQNQLPKAVGFFSSFLFKLTSFGLTLATIALITYQIGVTHNEQLSPLTGHNLTSDYLKKTNPVLFFQPVKGLLEFGLVHLYTYAVILLPTLLINLIFIFRRTGPLPSFVWDINIFSAGLVYIVQGYFLVGPLFFETPKAYRVDPSNLIFWELNLLPVITCLVNILVLTPFRRPVAGAGQGQGDSKKKR